MRATATLRLLDKADKQIRELPRTVKGAVYEFQYKFRENPNGKGLNLKRLQGGNHLYSARVTEDYRALLLHTGGNDYVLLGVRPRQDTYDNLDRRYRPQVNQVTGGLEFLEIVPSTEAAPDTAAVPVLPAAPDTPEEEATNPYLGGVTAAQLRELGVAEVLIPSALAVRDETELLKLVDYAPSLTEEVLLALADGHSPEQVMEQVTRPVKTEDDVDPSDFSAALRRTATRVTTTDTDLVEAIEDAFSRWKVFLHPTQRRLVERTHRGPARVSGGPGTGKTIVALHRVKYLVDRLPPGRDARILLTTFNRNLAADLRTRLLELGGPEVVERVDIAHVDQVANRVVTEAATAQSRQRISDLQALEEWRDMLAGLSEEERGGSRWDAEFLNAEWTQVILGQGIRTRGEYFRARRAGRGRRVSRAQRAEIWQLVERFTMRLDEKKVWTHRQVAGQAADIKRRQAESVREHQREAHSSEAPRFDYDHIVVDEAQDLSAAHWTMLRAMVPEQPNDLFLVGDPHQRIYDNYVSLASLGINIRGRSSRLTLSYRTTREILGAALGMLGDETWDDLDEGIETLAGYRSVLNGAEPWGRGTATWEEELALLTETIGAWTEQEARRAEAENRIAERNVIAVAVPNRDMVAQVRQHLTSAGIRSVRIGADGPPNDPDVVHVGTLHRFKGLEYRHVAVAGACAGRIPRAEVHELRHTDPQRYRQELQRARSLLFVAATRARDSLVISWHGAPSPVLPARFR